MDDRIRKIADMLNELDYDYRVHEDSDFIVVHNSRLSNALLKELAIRGVKYLGVKSRGTRPVLPVEVNVTGESDSEFVIKTDIFET